MTKTPTLYCDGSERELSWKYEICGTCEGQGSHSLRFGAITADQKDEWDPDEWESYMSGDYDEPCGCEHGMVRVVDRSKCTKDDLAAWDSQVQDDIEMASMQRAEMGLWREL